MKRKIIVIVTFLVLVGCILLGMGSHVSASENNDNNRKQEEYRFTYRLYVDYMEYYSFRKGHDGEYTISYTVNDEKSYTTTMEVEGFKMFNCQPTFISHYVDIPDVSEGDTIEYTYSYMNYYMQYDTPSTGSGVIVVE